MLISSSLDDMFVVMLVIHICWYSNLCIISLSLKIITLYVQRTICWLHNFETAKVFIWKATGNRVDINVSICYIKFGVENSVQLTATPTTKIAQFCVSWIRLTFKKQVYLINIASHQEQISRNKVTDSWKVWSKNGQQLSETSISHST